MRADARVKWRFRRSAVVVSLRNGSTIRGFAVSCSRASPRDAIPLTLRLPRPRCGLAMTNLKRFYLGNGRFCFMRPFCAVLPRIVFQTFRSKNCSVFPKNLPDLSLRGGCIFCARRGNLKRNDLSSRNEIWLDGTKQNSERKRKRNEAAKSMFFVIGLPSCFPLPCFATGCHTFGLKIAMAALRPRNDTN